MSNSFLIKSVIITAIVVFVGVLIISPAFFEKNEKLIILLSFDLFQSDNLEIWCKDLSQFAENGLSFTIFINGRLAENHPSCVNSFGKNVDIGSQTYSNLKLTDVNDYSKELEEIGRGKKIIDEIGNFNSKLFRAPGMSTDDNIFSLLRQNGVEFDLSYSDHYNKFHEGQFLRFDLITVDWNKIETTSFTELDKDIPILINLDNSASINEVKNVVDILKKKNVSFVNPTDLMGKDLTFKN